MKVSETRADDVHTITFSMTPISPRRDIDIRDLSDEERIVANHYCALLIKVDGFRENLERLMYKHVKYITSVTGYSRGEMPYEILTTAAEIIEQIAYLRGAEMALAAFEGTADPEALLAVKDSMKKRKR